MKNIPNENLDREVDKFLNIIEKIAHGQYSDEEALDKLNEHFDKIKINEPHLFENVHIFERVKEGLNEVGFKIDKKWQIG
ncbi:hypothetical protein V3O24_09010 [Methylobacter sp. Wu8]|uniref:hypothetical protein n=1 Tax=Methylobacter sp. Wu8 TaxID=3118457 RepID=UPI002F329575